MLALSLQEGAGTTYPATPAFYGYMGASLALVFANAGAAFGTYRAGVGIGSIGVTKPELIMKSIIPVVMAGILGIYGMIVSVILIQKVTPSATYTLYNGYAHLAAGLCCGLSSMAAGYAIGIVGNAGVKANAL
mmetsp:Transcript_121351/g.170613  ORF Transcript_121351/g.170613 Transcript_121351/m.170613 type:complete len:133 (-) Transcript_121351:296-694(-)